jgi:hypothetical protein
MKITYSLFFIILPCMISCGSGINPEIFENLDYSVLSGKHSCIDPGHQ